ncbi:hypothetical protein [uncultured Psychroserpens sp.]|uniref:hypothetical protein n=1 Tax=uncultured Psychroserpens sp. TaxID=255436 RepID=UPI0026224EA6|nr:hypothetical protein [uncultured Psychroserpens sp.]
MKKLILLLISLITYNTYAQDSMLQSNNEQLEDKAVKITQTYSDQLSLTGKQFMLFQKTVEEFLIRREKIENAYKGKEKLKLLYEMQEVETKEMNDILTRPQLDLYKKIKLEIQPLDKVEEKK